VAWCLAMGRPAWVDPAYFVTMLVFAGCGTAFAAIWLSSLGVSPFWALGFAVLPGTLICADRMTVDVALYASIAAALAAAARQRWTLCWIAVACAALSRDLGFLLVVAMVMDSIFKRTWSRATSLALTVVPTLCWYTYLNYALRSAPASPVVPTWTRSIPVVSHFLAVLQPPPYTLSPLLTFVTQQLDRAVVVGTALAACLAIRRLWRRPPGIETWMSLGYVGVFLMVGTPQFWHDPYSSVRAFTPLVAFVALTGPPRFGWSQAPLIALLSRTLWQMGPEMIGICRAAWRLVS
jgi:hypothetical protein